MHSFLLCYNIYAKKGDSMQRYFVKEKITSNIVHITEDFHHIKNVMRMKTGDNIIVTDQESAHVAEIVGFTDDSVQVELMGELESNELPINITIGIGMMQNKKMDFIIQKLTELGVHEIIPIKMTRSIVKPKDNKLERWKKIAKEASEQSHRMRIPIIQSPMSLKEIRKLKIRNKFLAYETSEEQSTITNLKEDALFIVGPEGGIDPEERQYLLEEGFTEISLGKRILRAETAPLFIMSVVGYSIEMSD